MAVQILHGVSGIPRWAIPNGASASSTACLAPSRRSGQSLELLQVWPHIRGKGGVVGEACEVRHRAREVRLSGIAEDRLELMPLQRPAPRTLIRKQTELRHETKVGERHRGADHEQAVVTQCHFDPDEV